MLYAIAYHMSWDSLPPTSIPSCHLANAGIGSLFQYSVRIQSATSGSLQWFSGAYASCSLSVKHFPRTEPVSCASSRRYEPTM